MSDTQQYTDAFKREVVQRASSGAISVSDLARELNISASTIYRWRRTLADEPAPPPVPEEPAAEASPQAEKAPKARKKGGKKKKGKKGTKAGKGKKDKKKKKSKKGKKSKKKK